MESTIVPSDDPVIAAVTPTSIVNATPTTAINVMELDKVVPILVVTANREPPTTTTATASDCKKPLTPAVPKNEGESKSAAAVVTAVESTTTTTAPLIDTNTTVAASSATHTASAAAEQQNDEKTTNNNELIEIESDLMSLKPEKPLHNCQVETESQANNKPAESLIDSLLDQQQDMSTVVCIKESMLHQHSYDDSADDVDEYEIHEMPMHHDHNEEEFTDTLSPLMNDNCTFLHHEESYLQNSSDDELDAVEKASAVAVLNPLAPTFMKHSDTKDSISSIDSDLSLGYDRNRRDSHGSVPTPENQRYDSHSSSDENAKDSGCDVKKGTSGVDESTEQPPIEIPDEAMAKQIVEQVEFYFSDESLLKDAFLLKHVRRNKEGFVSLKLVSSFKRVRQLTKDWRVVGHAIKVASTNIQLNDLETKIRRVDPLPVHDETTPSRTVVATGLPFNKLTIEKVSDIFSRCGEIALVRILRPGGPIPADVRQFINKHPELQANECALVEFTESLAARKAQNMEGLIVFELVAPKKKTGKKANVTKFIENFKYQSEAENERSRGGESINRFNNRFRKISSGMMPAQVPTSPSSPPHQATQIYQPPARRISFNNTDGFDSFHQTRRFSNTVLTDASRKFSNNSDGYSSYSDMSRRVSNCSDSVSRRASNCSEIVAQRRSSNCSDMCCPCSRRMSQCSENYAPPLPPRPYSASSNYQINERKYSQNADHMMIVDNRRRVSADSNYDRKYSAGSMHYGDGQMSPQRKFSHNGGHEIMRKSSNLDQYYNRKISNDSGYDRRASIGSDTMSSTAGSYHSNMTPRSRVGCPHQHGGGVAVQTAAVHAESVVRTPIGPDPDGNKGFITRARRFGQVIPPV